jgi:uncharacterized protein (TIGR00288 family)
LTDRDRFDDAPNLAIFCDYENVAIGVRDARYQDFDIQLVLERLLDKGKIVVKKAYADWERYKSAKRGMHEAAFEMIEIPHVSYSGKNSADIRLVVDALDLCHTKQHVDCFVIVSGDSDFSPLVSKLRENAKQVIGLGVKSSSSHLLIDNCDEFIYYDDLVRQKQGQRRTESGAPSPQPRNRNAPKPAPRAAQPPRETSSAVHSAPAADEGDKTAELKNGEKGGEKGPEKSVEERQLEAIDMVLDVVEALFTDRTDALHGSLIKQVLKRKRPEFSERFHGYRTFTELLEDAGKRGLLEVTADVKSGGFVVSGFGPNA